MSNIAAATKSNAPSSTLCLGGPSVCPESFSTAGIHHFNCSALIFLSIFLSLPLCAQNPSVPSDFGALPDDLLLSYGFQYQATPRHVGKTSDAFVLPGSISFNLNSRWVLRVDATTLKSVQYPSQGARHGRGDMDADISFAVLHETLSRPGVTLDYQLNVPTGDSTQKLGTGEFGHRFAFGLTKGRKLWKYQGTFGDLSTRRAAGYDYSNAVFGAISVTYPFEKKGSPIGVKLIKKEAVPTIKNEIDFIPPYSATAQMLSLATSNLHIATEIYTVSTLSLPLKWNTKLGLVGRVGLTPYTPKFIATIQLQHMFRHGS